MSNFGDINTGLDIGASQSVRRNASDTGFEAFTPGVGDMEKSVYDPAGGNKQVAFIDDVENLLNTKQDTLVSGVNIKTINNIPVTGSGNIDITSSGGGGGEKPIYLTSINSTTNPAYKQLSYTPEVTETTVSATANNNTVTLQTYIFDLPIGVTSIDAGNWSFYVNGFVSNAGGVSNAIVETYKRDTGGTETLLFSVTSPEINNTSYAPLNFPTSTQGVFTVNTTDKIVSKLLFKTTATVDRTFTYKVGDGSASYFTTPLALRHNETRARDASDAHPASSITNTPSGNITSTNVQLAINELDTEKATDTAVVHKTGNETIAGIKTFSSSPIVPTPTTDTQASTKKYVDDGLATKGDVTLNGTQTLTNKRIISRVYSETSNATPTINANSYDEYKITALATAATFGAPTGTPTDGQIIIYKIKDNGTARALNWNAIYRAGSTVSLPTTTTAGKWIYVGFEYNSTDVKWDLLGVSNGF